MSAQMMTMMTPEVMLAGLNHSGLELYAVAGSRLKSERGRQLRDQLRDVLRRTIAIEAVSGADYCAIAGSQGAGKTTLLALLYELPRHVLSPNAGVGEQVPLLVVEDPDIAAPTRVLRRISEDGVRATIADFPPDDQQWADALAGKDGATMIMVLRVPVRYFGGARRGFVLLPGYETKSRGNRVRQTLMREALVSAQGAIVVTDRTRLADEKNSAILADLAKHITAPIVVVAKSESLDPQSQMDLTKTAVDRLGALPGNVVFTGLDSRDVWLPRLTARLGTLTCNDSTRTRQLVALGEVLDALATVEDGIAEELDAEHLKSEITPAPWEGLIAEYDREARTVLESFEKELLQPMADHTDRAATRAKQHSRQNDGGLLNPIKNYFMNAYELDDRRRRSMRDAWQRERANALIAEVAHSAAHKAADKTVARVTRPGRRPSGGLGGKPTPRALTDARQAGESAPSRVQGWSELVLPEPLLRDLAVLAGATMQTEPKELLNAARVLPALALEAAALGLRGELSNVEQSDATGTATHQRTVGMLLNSLGEHRAVMIGLAALLGVDVMLDGSVDGTIATAGSIKAALMASGVSSGVATFAMGVGGLAAGTLIAINRVNEADRARIREINQTMAAYRDETIETAVSEARELLDQGRESLVRRGRELHRLDEAWTNRIWAGKVLADVREQRVRLERAIHSNPLAVLAT